MKELRFSNFVLDLRTDRLARAEQELGIGWRDEIVEAVWPHGVVGDKNMNLRVANPCLVVVGDL